MAKSLTEYRRKRRFKETPEPAGKSVRRKGPLTFVVHLHDATRLHYDLRLELDGTLKSWAVPKGPSLNPTEQRLAVQVEDHPVEYGKFEGIIPEGNYGAGPVIAWDRGTYTERRSTTREESEAALRRGLAKGHITFILDGKKLKGEFALVRMKDGRNWLLIKKGDQHASYKAHSWDSKSIDSKKTLSSLRQVAEHRPKDGGKFRMMMPLGKREKPTGAGWIFQEFGGGNRVFLEVHDGKPTLVSRARVGLNARYPDFLKKTMAQRMPKTSMVLDGEIAGNEFHVLDVLSLEGKDLRKLPLSKRLAVLKKIKFPPTILVAPLLGASSSGTSWIARDKSSLYVAGLSAKWVRSRAAVSTRFSESATRILGTHLTKKLFPEDGFTKKDLIEYYAAVAPVMLPHLKDRPLSLQRFPNGIKSKGFFQKDLSGYLPPGVGTFAHASSSSDRTIHYVVCNNELTLRYLANLAAIELNPWLSQIPEIDAPDFSVIDLDPDGNPFSEVIKVALVAKEILESIGIRAFCKTSGATGLHLYVPLQSPISFDESREFALRVCEKVHARFPTLTSLERSPTKRRKKIYLDCFQNSRGQTVVAPYSVRPRSGATVSTPLLWKEVKVGLDPADFHIKSVPARIAKIGDPWADLLKRRYQPGKALKKLR